MIAPNSPSVKMEQISQRRLRFNLNHKCFYLCHSKHYTKQKKKNQFLNFQFISKYGKEWSWACQKWLTPYKLTSFQNYFTCLPAGLQSMKPENNTEQTLINRESWAFKVWKFANHESSCIFYHVVSPLVTYLHNSTAKSQTLINTYLYFQRNISFPLGPRINGCVPCTTSVPSVAKL
jgi:hypothetical protein